MQVALHYGSGKIVLDVPECAISQCVQPRNSDAAAQHTDCVKQAIDRAVFAFSQSIEGRTAGVLVPDGTRDLPLETIWPRLFPRFAKARKVVFFICTGTHNADTPENRAIIRTILTGAAKAGIADVEIVSHDCRHAEFISAGATRRQTEILYNARLREPDVFLAVSDIKPHYFAGYSNPVKNFVPGLCAFKTTEQNHSWTMDDHSRAGVHPWHPDPLLRDNPLADDQLEAMQAIVGDRPVWALTMLSSGGRIQWADFGPAPQAAAQAFLQADRWNNVDVRPVRRMIVSPGGLPNDVDLYIAQRALELSAGAVCDGGEILFLSACPNGVGSPLTSQQFYDKLICPLDAIEAADRKDYKLFSHKPWRFARLIRRLSRLWLHSRIDAATIEKMHMTPCPDPQAVVNDWLRQNPGEQILIVDSANKLLLRPA